MRTVLLLLLILLGATLALPAQEGSPGTDEWLSVDTYPPTLSAARARSREREGIVRRLQLTVAAAIALLRATASRMSLASLTGSVFSGQFLIALAHAGDIARGQRYGLCRRVMFG